VRTFRDVLDRFREHPEAKSGNREGNPSDKKTIGLLRRLPVELFCIFHIGKETNLIEQQEEGVALADPQLVYSGGGEWEAIRAWMESVSSPKLAALSGINERTPRTYRQGTRRPPPESVGAIAEALARMPDGR
jgi:hypothetical protein